MTPSGLTGVLLQNMAITGLCMQVLPKGENISSQVLPAEIHAAETHIK